jgi:hypothetical protein
VIKTFFNGYKDSLKHLDINLIGSQLKEVIMRAISDLISLESLQMVLNTGFDDIFIENLKLIAQKCAQIKDLVFRFEFCLGNSEFVHQVVDSISYFTQIQSLKFKIVGFSEYFDTIHVKSFNECKKLTKFEIKFEQINDYFFNDINLYLPQLTHLRVSINRNISDNCLESLSKLQNLKSVVFEPFFDVKPDSSLITDSAICHFIDKCPSIQSIHLERGPNISHKTVETLIALALRRPQIDFYYFFESIENCSSIPLNDINANNKSFPNNMKLTIIYINNYVDLYITQKF